MDTGVLVFVAILEIDRCGHFSGVKGMVTVCLSLLRWDDNE